MADEILGVTSARGVNVYFTAPGTLPGAYGVTIPVGGSDKDTLGYFQINVYIEGGGSCARNAAVLFHEWGHVRGLVGLDPCPVEDHPRARHAPAGTRVKRVTRVSMLSKPSPPFSLCKTAPSLSTRFATRAILEITLLPACCGVNTSRTSARHRFRVRDATTSFLHAACEWGDAPATYPL